MLLLLLSAQPRHYDGHPSVHLFPKYHVLGVMVTLAMISTFIFFFLLLQEVL